jgi:hypothetical protein
MKRTMAAELAAVQKIPSVDAARARLNNRLCRRSKSMSLIEFAGVTMPATSAGTSTLNWRARVSRHSWHMARAAKPARADRWSAMLGQAVDLHGARTGPGQWVTPRR